MMPTINEISRVCSTARLQEILSSNDSKWILIQVNSNRRVEVTLSAESVGRMMAVGNDSGASMVYSDFYDATGPGLQPHPVNDWQLGSVRDDFDFGPIVMVRRTAMESALKMCGEWEYAGWYALWLALSHHGELLHIKEKLYVATLSDSRSSGEQQFDYVDPRNRIVQIELEEVFTQYLKAIGAWLPQRAEQVDISAGDFPVEASVIIPVKNRARTIAQAVESALNQRADFAFNVIVVDNHSTDGTTEIVGELARRDSRVIHIVPPSQMLAIGGCWNLAVADERCGRFAVQLDSDDIYKDETTLQQVVELFRSQRCAMVVGSYELVDMDGNPIPPGLIDHKEWTAQNGHNNALRINGLGAPRAFFTPVLRAMPIPDVSYGEDYAMGLRISRKYMIGRIYNSLYLCRRWEGNSDAALSVERVNANNDYKDFLRTLELKARIALNANAAPPP